MSHKGKCVSYLQKVLLNTKVEFPHISAETITKLFCDFQKLNR